MSFLKQAVRLTVFFGLCFIVIFSSVSVVASPSGAAGTDTPDKVLLLLKNTTSKMIEFSWYSPAGQIWLTLDPGVAQFAQIKKGPSGNLLLKLVDNGRVNWRNVSSPSIPGQVTILVKNSTQKTANFSYYSPSGQKWVTLKTGDAQKITIKRGPQGNLLLKVVE